MAGEQNLIKFTHETAAENGRKGGIASVAKRREKKTIRECLMMLRDMPMTDSQCAELGLQPETTYGMAMAQKCVDGTIDGNPTMARLVFEMLGESKQEIDISGSIPVVIHDDI